MITTDVENFPGFPSGIQGPELMQKIREQATRFGAKILDEDVLSVDFSSSPIAVKTKGSQFKAKTCIVSTGASAIWLGIDSETRLKGKGISGCATCDGFFFKDKDIVVIGGGDSAMEEALFLTKFAKSIKILVRKDVLRASAIMQERAEKHEKIEIVFNTEVKEFHGENALESITVINNKTGKETTLSAQGAFVAIGHKPNTEIFSGQIELDKKGYIIRKNFSQTSKENVFVAGDVHDHRYRQAITAAGYGCEAAIDAMRYLDDHS